MLTIVFWICLAAQMGYMLVFFRKAGQFPTQESFVQGERKGASIIICSKNEGENLKKNLPMVLSQKYFGVDSSRLFEVIVVDNGSTDTTLDVLKALQEQHQHLVIVQEPKEGKKNAMKAGVATTSHNWLVFTDADCRPLSNNWLRAMLLPLSAGKGIVLGYSGFYEAKGLLNKFIRWETIHTFLQYSTYAMSGLPYMAVGRNMACTRDIVEGVMQNPKWNKLSYGDDDLLVSLAGTRRNTAVVCEYHAFTYSKAKKSWGEWVRQKQRHLSVGKYYKLPVKVLLGFYGITHAAMWISFIALLSTANWKWVLAGMGLRCVFYSNILDDLSLILREPRLPLFFPVFDIGWMMYNFAFLPYIAFKNKQNWK